MTSPAETIATAAGAALLKRSNRRTLAISVLPDGSLELAAPENAKLEAIVARVEKRLNWIGTQRRAFSVMNAVRPSLRYQSGATHRYLGRQYRLKVSTAPVTSVALRGGWLHVGVLERTQAATAAALNTWYRQRAKEQFTRRLAAWKPWCVRHRLPPPRLRIRCMAKRWGSARHDGTIALSPELIRTSSACVDYVIAHEICHLKHPHHGPAFRRLLMQLCPGWQKLKARLEAQ